VAKTLCDWKKKDVEKHFEELCAMVADPRYVCRKCARCAHFPRFLCKPKKVKLGNFEGVTVKGAR